MIDRTAKIGKNACIGPNVCIGANADIEDGVRMINSVVMAESVIKSHAFVSSSIIGRKCTIGRAYSAWLSIFNFKFVGKWVRIENTSVIGEDVIVKDELYLNGASVLPHKSISSNVPEPQIIM